MPIAWDPDVLAIAPELSAVPDTTRTMLLRIVDAQVAERNWDDLRDVGMIYLAAHLGSLTLKRGEGPVTDRSAGGLSVSYASMLELAGNLGLTAYGVEYERLLMMTLAPLGLVVGEGGC